MKGQNSFPGRYYPEGSADGTGVEISVKRGQIELVSSDGQLNSIPLSDIELKSGGFEGNRVIITCRSSGDTIVCEDSRFLKTLKSLGGRHLHREIDDTHSKVKWAPAAHTATWIVSIFVIGVIVVGVIVGIEMGVDLAAEKMPTSFESSISSIVARSYEKDPGFDADEEDLARLRGIVKKLVAALGKTDYNFHVHERQSDEINAFALPGGFIIVNSKLVAEAKSDDEIAGVLGHEIGHVIHRHSLKDILRKAGLGACLKVVVGDDTGALAATLAEGLELDNLRFSRFQEEDADLIGVKLTKDAGYDPEALINFFDRLQSGSDWAGSELVGIISTHPLPKDRAEKIRQEIQRLQSAEDR